MKRIRGFINMTFDLVEETNSLAELTHTEVVTRSVSRFAPVEPVKTAAMIVAEIQGAIAGMVFGSVRGINNITRGSVNTIVDIAEQSLELPLASDKYTLATPMQSTAAGSLNWCVDFLQSSLNGLWGDYFTERNSAFASQMTLRHNGHILPPEPESLAAVFPAPTGKLCVFVHSLAATEWLWTLSSAQHYDGDSGVNFGTRLREDLGFTPVFIRYNSGLHISINGQQLANLMAELVDNFPVSVQEIALVGHSMGGLVARSAATYARDQNLGWVNKLRHVACIGAPNLGAPLEKTVNMLSGALSRVDAAGTQVTAKLLRSRSAGVKDLRYGYTHDDEWLGKDPDTVFTNARLDIPLLDGVGYYFFAATISKDPGHPLGRLFGDLLVRLPSASGDASNPARKIPFSSGKVFPGMNHIHIVNHPAIYEALRDQLDTETKLAAEDCTAVITPNTKNG